MSNTKLNVELIREKMNMIQSCYDEIFCHIEGFANDDEYTEFADYFDIEESQVEDLMSFIRKITTGSSIPHFHNN